MEAAKETVTMSLERYEELMDIKKKYEDDNRSELENRCENLKISNEQYAYDNNWLSRNFKSEVKEHVNMAVEKVVFDIVSNANCLGYISKDNVQKIKSAFLESYNDKEIIVWEEHSSKNRYDIPISKNVTDNVSNQDFITLQRDIDFLVYKFMSTHNIPNGERINYSIDDVQVLKKEGIETPYSDRYLALLDDSNNTLIEST